MRFGDHRLTLFFFMLTLATMLVMQQYFPAELAIPLPGSDIRPVLLLEFAAKPEHLTHVFGEIGDPMRDARIAGMNTGNSLDYLLMPAYGLLTFSFFRGISAESPGSLWSLFGWMGVIAALSDAVENALMFRIVAEFVAGNTGTYAEMALLPYPVWIKFGLLAVTCGGAALAFIRLRRWLLALLCLPAPLMLVPGMLNPFGIAPLSTTMIGLGWLAMAVHAGTRWYRSGANPDQSKL
ncbi:hypothetical protein [Altererythrobacter sp. Z27]|uniref:hypothetical protein n=1 Tax=Altererythrobacter sp. Z27 TaxID=3461147 RepID=UPI004043F12B